MHKLKEWAIRKKRWLMAAVGRAIRSMAQAAACGLIVLLREVDLLTWAGLRDILTSALYIAAVGGIASVLKSIYEYGKTEREDSSNDI